MKETRYDGDLQMFVDEPRNFDPKRLRFLRWLAERDQQDGRVLGPATGPLMGLAAEHQNTGVGGGISDNESPAPPRGQFMTRHIAGLGPARMLGI